MSRSPLDNERFHRLQGWWSELPLSYRVNTALYLLGAVGILVVLFNVLTGDDDPRQTQVAAGVSATTTTLRGGPTTTRLNAATTSSTVGESTTTVAAAGSAAPSSGAAAPSSGGGGGTGGAGTGGGGSGGGGSGGGAGGGGGGGGPDPTTTTTALVCRNSTDPRCGFFRWDPEPSNQFPVVSDFVILGSRTVGQVVTIGVTVAEPDHALANACGVMNFGDNTPNGFQGNCEPRPCPEQYGPWTPPAPGTGGTRTFVFQHIFTSPGEKTLAFQLESREYCNDPYGTTQGTSTKIGHVTISPPTTTSTTGT